MPYATKRCRIFILLAESKLRTSLRSCPLAFSPGASSPPAIGLRLSVVSKGHRKSITTSLSHSGLPPSCSHGAHFRKRPSGSEGRKRTFPVIIRSVMKFSGGGISRCMDNPNAMRLCPLAALSIPLYGDRCSLNKWCHFVQCRGPCICAIPEQCVQNLSTTF